MLLRILPQRNSIATLFITMRLIGITSKRVTVSYGIAWRYCPNSFALATPSRFRAGQRISSFVCCYGFLSLGWLNGRLSGGLLSLFTRRRALRPEPAAKRTAAEPVSRRNTHRLPSTISPWVQAGGLIWAVAVRGRPRGAWRP
jgi:hypothetical protein